MWKIHDELWRCEICGSVVRRDQINGVCSICGRRTCINCRRVCERCQKIFCMDHVRKVEVWRQRVMTRLTLCENCEKVW